MFFAPAAIYVRSKWPVVSRRARHLHAVRKRRIHLGVANRIEGAIGWGCDPRWHRRVPAVSDHTSGKIVSHPALACREVSHALFVVVQFPIAGGCFCARLSCETLCEAFDRAWRRSAARLGAQILGASCLDGLLRKRQQHVDPVINRCLQQFGGVVRLKIVGQKRLDPPRNPLRVLPSARLPDVRALLHLHRVFHSSVLSW